MIIRPVIIDDAPQIREISSDISVRRSMNISQAGFADAENLIQRPAHPAAYRLDRAQTESQGALERYAAARPPLHHQERRGVRVLPGRP